MRGLKPDLISNFLGMEMMSCPRSHEFLSRIVGSEGFLLGFLESGQSFLESRKEGFSKYRVRARFITIE